MSLSVCDPRGVRRSFKALRELHNDYTLAPDKTEIKKEMLPN